MWTRGTLLPHILSMSSFGWAQNKDFWLCKDGADIYNSTTSTKEVLAIALITGLFWRAPVNTGVQNRPSSCLNVWDDKKLYPHVNYHYTRSNTSCSSFLYYNANNKLCCKFIVHDLQKLTAFWPAGINNVISIWTKRCIQHTPAHISCLNCLENFKLPFSSVI
jgi:hypothetical protein